MRCVTNELHTKCGSCSCCNGNSNCNSSAAATANASVADTVATVAPAAGSSQLSALSSQLTARSRQANELPVKCFVWQKATEQSKCHQMLGWLPDAATKCHAHYRQCPAGAKQTIAVFSGTRGVCVTADEL